MSDGVNLIRALPNSIYYLYGTERAKKLIGLIVDAVLAGVFFTQVEQYLPKYLDYNFVLN